MKKYLIVLSVFFSYTSLFAQKTLLKAAFDLIRRQLPFNFNQILSELIPADDNHDVFEIESVIMYNNSSFFS